MCGRSWIVDRAESHGISELQSSRLGGVAVFFGAVAFFIAAEWAKGNSLGSIWSSFSLQSDYAQLYLGRLANRSCRIVG